MSTNKVDSSSFINETIVTNIEIDFQVTENRLLLMV